MRRLPVIRSSAPELRPAPLDEGGHTLDDVGAGPQAADGLLLVVEVLVEAVAGGGVDEPAGLQQGSGGGAGHLGGQTAGGGPHFTVGYHLVGQAAGGELGGGDAAVAEEGGVGRRAAQRP